MQNYLLLEPVPSPRPLPGDLVVEPLNESIDKKYKVRLSLGSGASGSVVLAKDRSSKEDVAIKIIKKQELNQTQMMRLQREYGIMKKLDHPNWVKLHQVFEDSLEVCLVMEYAACGDLFTRITEAPRARLAETDARPIFAQMAAGLLYLHQSGFVHRDIKPENVLLTKDGRVLLADLGFAAMWNNTTLTSAPCGSLYYASPEIIKHDGVYFGPEVDVWSLGATLYAMTCGKLPFAGDSNDEIRDLILEGDFSYPFYISQQLRSLISGMLRTNPTERMTMEAVVAHQWTTGGTTRKVANARRHSAFSGFLSLRGRPKDAPPVFDTEEELEIYMEIQRLKQEIKETEQKQKEILAENSKSRAAAAAKRKKGSAKQANQNDEGAGGVEKKKKKKSSSGRRAIAESAPSSGAKEKGGSRKKSSSGRGDKDKEKEKEKEKKVLAPIAEEGSTTGGLTEKQEEVAGGGEEDTTMSRLRSWSFLLTKQKKKRHSIGL